MVDFSLNLVDFNLNLVKFDHKTWIRPNSTLKFKIWNSNEFEQIRPSLLVDICKKIKPIIFVASLALTECELSGNSKN